MTKKIKLPASFTAHDGGPCPVEPEQYVETVIRTGEGLGSGGVTKASDHEWSYDAHDAQEGLGEVLGYRLARRGEEAVLDPYDRYTLTTGRLKPRG